MSMTSTVHSAISKMTDNQNIGEVVIECQPPNPIFKTTKGWYFWDEVWANAIGPFNTKTDAQKHLKEYANYL